LRRARRVLAWQGQESPVEADATGAGAGGGVLDAAVTGAAGFGVLAGTPAPPPITATTELTVTVSPSLTRISVSVPAIGDGISASTLSVEISKIGSSRATLSPTFLSHLVSVPSVMDSPICGMRTSVPEPVTASGMGAGTAWSLAAVATAAGVTVSSLGVTAGAGADEPASSMAQTTVPTVTVAPSWTLISPSVPAAGEGISASTLSVEISKSGSSRATVSPVFFSHLVRVPSVMDSPIWGMTTSVGMGKQSPERSMAREAQPSDYTAVKV